MLCNLSKICSLNFCQHQTWYLHWTRARLS